MLKTHDFYYDLPEELIAQTPLERRDASRLMTLDRKTGEVTHRHFYDLVDLLQPGDCLVMNNSRVLPARLLGHREPTGGAVEVLHAKELAAFESAEEKAKFVAEKEQEYRDKFSNPYNAARYGYIDDVIEPRNTRFRIIRALQSLATKRLQNPAKKLSLIHISEPTRPY